MPGSVEAWPASQTTSKRHSGQAFFSAQEQWFRDITRFGAGAQTELKWILPENFCCKAEAVKEFERWLAHPRLKDYMLGIPPPEKSRLDAYEAVLQLRGKVADIVKFE